MSNTIGNRTQELLLKLLLLNNVPKYPWARFLFLFSSLLERSQPNRDLGTCLTLDHEEPLLFSVCAEKRRSSAKTYKRECGGWVHCREKGSRAVMLPSSAYVAQERCSEPIPGRVRREWDAGNNFSIFCFSHLFSALLPASGLSQNSSVYFLPCVGLNLCSVFFKTFPPVCQFLIPHSTSLLSLYQPVASQMWQGFFFCSQLILFSFRS